MSTEKLAALTFDDGPNTTTTADMLDMLKKHGVSASFFVCGDNITPETEKVMRRAAEMGCEIQNHSRTHSVMSEMTAEEIAEEIRFTSDKIEAAVGKRPKFFRPPYIAYNQLMFDTIDLTFICGYGAEDWLDEVSPEERCRRIMEQVCDGAVILLHDMEGNFRTVEAVDMIIPKMKAEGYRFVTVSQLFAEKGITPKRGTIYSNALKD